ncbi:MAG TPA: BCAM0308 family protein [Usitatibacter sp.]|nr:BCAM0308 family protein [Usitatibacter sp.]
MKPLRGNVRSLSRVNPQDHQRAAGRGDDPYSASERPPEPTFCPRCKAVFADGRWTWARKPDESFEQNCPACQRIEDEFPAGYVTIRGEFIKQHRDEIIALLKSKEDREKADHPLQRIMAIEDVRDGLQVTTTDSHLARGIGEALHDAYKGDLKLRYSRDENLLRATWKR